MYAISTTDVRKFVALAQSVSAAFNADVMQGQQAISINNGQDMTVQQDRARPGTSPVQSDLQAIKAALEDYAIGQGLGGEVEVGMAPQGIVIRLNDALLFSSGRAHLDDHALKLVKQVVDIVKPLPNQIRIEGNTDDQPPDGVLYASNWDLSTARALAVLEAMVDHGHGPEPALGPGQRPVQPDRAQHRRRLAGQEPPRRHRRDLPGATPAPSPAPMALPTFDEPHDAGAAGKPFPADLEYRS